MSSKLSQFVNLSPLQAALWVLLGRLRLPARYADGLDVDARVEPAFDDVTIRLEPAAADDRPLPYIADGALLGGAEEGPDPLGLVQRIAPTEGDQPPRVRPVEQ